jgi:hypothetical protein
MNCFGSSKLTQEQVRDKEQSRALDQEIKVESQTLKRHNKLLLLVGDTLHILSQVESLIA